MTDVPTLRPGDTGEYVTYAQQLLTHVSIVGWANIGPAEWPPVTGTFDEDTETVVRALQDSEGLDPDGIIGPVTWPVLMERSGRDRDGTVVFDGDVVEGTSVSLPTYEDSEAARHLVADFIDRAADDARFFAALSNEWALYDGNEEGKEAFLKVAETLIQSRSVGRTLMKAGVEFTIGWVRAVTAANNADEISALTEQVYDAVESGFMAGLFGEGATWAPSNELLADVQAGAYDYATQIPREQWGGVVLLLLRVGDADTPGPGERLSDEKWAALVQARGYMSSGLKGLMYESYGERF
jgi:hypothetical protein